ncbi:uncharacterized protein LOC5501320 isoform X1 [Nematostella vectensis]|uniref:uncharacterized protein LOC5501320 isoform X1 n=1 Tax=Nematostella vectensis TaxID=45351 RepID=UPI0020773C32|nr:uncharacterized protein LOC5501320 isoform X1 [Nematostella vectensis]
MPPILELLTLRRRSRMEWFYDIIQVFHFMVVMVFLWAGLVEFIRDPPFFDAYGDAATRNELPEGLFENDPRSLDKMQSLRLMDIPILFMLLVYVGVCWLLKFRGLSWLLTFCFILTLTVFFFVNYWESQLFDWRYFLSRNAGLEVQVVFIALTFTSVFIVLFYERKKLPFKFKSTLPIRPFGKMHLFCNFFICFIIIFTCLTLWFSKLYMSWACFRNHKEIMSLCERTSMVQCYPCSTCSSDGLKHCVKGRHDNMFHCLSDMMALPDKGAFCLFNYNISAYTFMTVFAYVGGLVVFLSNFLRIVVHYFLRFVFFFLGWWKVKQNARDGHREPLEGSTNPLHVEEPSPPFVVLDCSQGEECIDARYHREMSSVSGLGVSLDEEEASDGGALVEAVIG